MKQGAVSEIDGCLECPSGTYSVAPGIDSAEKCIGCPQGKFSNVTGSSSDTCTSCPAGTYADKPRSSLCKACGNVGVYCEAGAKAETRCKTELEMCNGTARVPRPEPPGSFEIVDIDFSSLSIRLPDNGAAATNGAFYAAELAVSKEARSRGLENATVFESSQSGEQFIRVTNLNVGTSYYVRLRFVDRSGLVGRAGEWSDAVEFRCPDGAWCGDRGQEEGVPASAIVAMPSYFRIPWAPNNFTFVKCNASTTEGKSMCLGGNGSACGDGTTGPFCSVCLPGYSKSWSGDGCDECLPPSQQNAAFAGGTVFGVAVVAFLVRNTLKAQGNPSDQSVGVLKIGLRHFQLASMAASFPLAWPPQLESMFSVMNTASSAGDQAVALDCQLASSISASSPLLWLRSLFAAKALAGFLVPPILIAIFLAFWVAYGALVEGPRSDKAERAQTSTNSELEDPDNYRSTPRTRMIVSTLVLLLMFHPTITKATFAFFKCTNPIAGRSLLEADMTVVCGSKLHQSLIMFIALPSIVFYVIGIPAAALYLLLSKRHTLDASGTRQKLGFLYSVSLSANF